MKLKRIKYSCKNKDEIETIPIFLEPRYFQSVHVAETFALQRIVYLLKTVHLAHPSIFGGELDEPCA